MALLVKAIASVVSRNFDKAAAVLVVRVDTDSQAQAAAKVVELEEAVDRAEQHLARKPSVDSTVEPRLGFGFSLYSLPSLYV